MPSKNPETLNAETRFRQAFDRLKSDVPTTLDRGTTVTQNNVAREAGCDPSALKKSRFPALIREIQAYVELHKEAPSSKKQADSQARRGKRSVEDRLKDAIQQRDSAQSLIVSANRRILELTEQVQSLQRRLDELMPPPAIFGRK